jgi:hypothetical protein
MKKNFLKWYLEVNIWYSGRIVLGKSRVSKVVRMEIYPTFIFK